MQLSLSWDSLPRRAHDTGRGGHCLSHHPIPFLVLNNPCPTHGPDEERPREDRDVPWKTLKAGPEPLTNEKIFSLKGVLRAVLCEQCSFKHQKQTHKYIMAILGSGDKVHGSQHGGNLTSLLWNLSDEVLGWYESFSQDGYWAQFSCHFPKWHRVFLSLAEVHQLYLVLPSPVLCH